MAWRWRKDGLQWVVVAAALLTTAAPTTALAHNGEERVTGGDGDDVVVARALDNPRGIAWSNGRLLIAESGTGGNGSCVPGIFAESICLGRTGAVTEVDRRGRQRRVIEGLPSLAANVDPGVGTFAYGPSDVSTFAGVTFLTIGGPNDVDYVPLLPERIARKLGTVQLAVGPFTTTVADVTARVAEDDPDGGLNEVNPSGVLVSRRGLFIVDAASNSLYEVGRRGDLVLRQLFPVIPQPDGTSIEAVPTNLAVGPDGAIYVSTLTGVPFPEGAATVWRWDGHEATPFAGDLTTAIDLAFGDDGSLYVVEMALGRVLRIAPDGSRTVVVEGLDFPTGIAIGGGYLYVTNHGTSPDIGTVQRYPL